MIRSMALAALTATIAFAAPTDQAGAGTEPSAA